MNVLSEEEIKILEKYIVTHEPSQDDRIVTSISRNDLIYGKYIYKTLHDKPVTHIEIFGSNAFGYTCYSLYKARNRKIYVIQTYMQMVQAFTLISNEEWFNG